MDDALRNGLWNLLQIHCWNNASGYHLSEHGNQKLAELCNKLWILHYKVPLDTLPNNKPKALKTIRNNFFNYKWFEVYGFVEFVANSYPRYSFRERFITGCNHLLENEMSAYRFVDGVITRVTEQIEIDEIEQAIGKTSDPVADHLRRSLELLSDRKTPDYRNSIKESISAVESLAAITLNIENSTLGKLLNKLEKEIVLHPALKTAFSNLYGYTNDEGGIRHALIDSDKVGFDDAKFMIVACSAFVNFVRAKNGNRE